MSVKQALLDAKAAVEAALAKLDGSATAAAAAKVSQRVASIGDTCVNMTATINGRPTKHYQDEYMLAEVSGGKDAVPAAVSLINMDNGKRWKNGVDVVDKYNITEAEFALICGTKCRFEVQ